MKNEIMEELFCVKCSKKFSNHLASFSTTYAFKLHSSISHKKKNKLENDERANIYICVKCSKKFSNHLASFSTTYAFKMHSSISHKKKNKSENDERANIYKRHVASVHEGKKLFKC